MKVSVLIEEFGNETLVTREYDDGGDLSDVLRACHDAMVGAGFTYVESVAAEKRDGSLVWSD